MLLLFMSIIKTTMQKQYEIYGDIENGMTIYSNTQQRYFSVQFPQKFNKYGFGHLDAKQIIHNKLISRDFSYYFTKMELVIKILVNNGKIDNIFEIICFEIFPHIETDINADPDELKKLVLSLRNKVNNLTSQVDTLQEYIKIINDKYTYEDNN